MSRARPQFQAVWNFSNALAKVSTKARDAYREAVAKIDYSDPEEAAEQLKRIGRMIIDKYGIAARELGAQWYDYCRSLEIESGYTAGIGEVSRYSLDSDIDALTAKFKAGELPEEDYIARLGGLMANHIHKEARDVIMSNLAEENLKAMETGDTELQSKLGFCRVPVLDACAFCVLLASRSYYPWQQYGSERTAFRRKSDGEKYHDDCRCVIMPFVKATEIQGYQDKLASYNNAYRTADNTRKEGKKQDGEKWPKDLQDRMDEAKKRHEEANERRKEQGLKPKPWRSFNEDLVIMRYNNPDLR